MRQCILFLLWRRVRDAPFEFKQVPFGVVPPFYLCVSFPLEFLRERAGKGPVRSGIVVVFGLLAVAGLVLLVCSGSLARRLTEDFDE